VSDTSQVTGGATDGASDAARTAGGPAAPQNAAEKPGDRPGARSLRPMEIGLESSRQRSAFWTVGGLIAGALLIHSLGTVGVWVGVALIVMGVYHAWRLIQSVLHPAGTIVVSDREVSLPRGVCVPRPVVVTPSEITAVYFLRRVVPWNRAAPVLVIELGPRAMLFPRDWFASEADQRHVIHAILRAQGDPRESSTAGSSTAGG